MKRTIATIIGEANDVITIVHDDETGTLVGINHEGTEENVNDWRACKSWRHARKAVLTMYGAGHAYHDIWTLCLRPIEALRLCRSEYGAGRA